MLLTLFFCANASAASQPNIGGGTVPQDRPIDGIDITPVLSGGELEPRVVFWALASRSELEFAIREGSWKLMLDRNRKPRELYNLEEDPLEFFNLLSEEGYQAKRLQELFTQTLSSIESDPLRPHLVAE